MGEDCFLNDSLNFMALDSMNYNERGWYDRRGQVYVYIDYEKDWQNHKENRLWQEFEDKSLKIYTDSNEFTEFMQFVLEENETRKVWRVELGNLFGIGIHALDSIGRPEWIIIYYGHEFGSGMGSYYASEVQIWDIRNLTRVANFYSFYRQFSRSSDMQGMGERITHYALKREYTLTKDEIVFHKTDYTFNKAHQYQEDGHDKTDEEKKEFHCPELRYKFLDGQFRIVADDQE